MYLHVQIYELCKQVFTYVDLGQPTNTVTTTLEGGKKIFNLSVSVSFEKNGHYYTNCIMAIQNYALFKVNVVCSFFSYGSF